MKTSKFLVKSLLLFSLLSSCLFGLDFNQIENTMAQNIQKALAILQTSTQNQTKDSMISNAQAEQIAKEIFTLFDSIFDYNLMAQLSLSKDYKTLTQAQKEQYNQAFEQNLKKSFTDKLKLYKDEKIEVVGGEKTKPNRYNLKASIVLDGKLNFIVFKFHDNKGDWKIYDVDILGISVIQTYRSQFGDILAHSDFQTLLTKLKSEITFESQKQ